MKEKGITFKTYRSIDLSILAVLMIVFEVISINALAYFDQIFYFTSFYIIAYVAMVRWDKFSFVIPIVHGITYCLACNGNINSLIVYVVGNLFIMINLLWFIKGKKIIKNTYALICFIFTGFLAVVLGRSIVSMCFDLGNISFLDVFVGYIQSNTLSILLSIIILIIAKKQNGVLEDQKEYLLKLQEEKK